MKKRYSEKKHYSVKQLARLAGVSVRTLHLYDEIGLLKPSVRTEAGYRLYEEKELLRLQQILFYKELDFPLKDIGDILDDPGFDRVLALESHRTALLARKGRIDSLLITIDKTIFHLKKGDVMLSHEELYEGLPKEKAAGWRKEAEEKWGKDAMERSEMQLLTMTRENLSDLKAAFAENWKKLAAMSQTGTTGQNPNSQNPAGQEPNDLGPAGQGSAQPDPNSPDPGNPDPTSPEVQAAIRLHYRHIRQFWGTADQPASRQRSDVRPSVLSAYKCLGEMYTQDERYTLIDGKPNPIFADFLCKAIAHFVEKEQA